MKSTGSSSTTVISLSAIGRLMVLLPIFSFLTGSGFAAEPLKFKMDLRSRLGSSAGAGAAGSLLPKKRFLGLAGSCSVLAGFCSTSSSMISSSS